MSEIDYLVLIVESGKQIGRRNLISRTTIARFLQVRQITPFKDVIGLNHFFLLAFLIELNLLFLQLISHLMPIFH